ncbi:cysteine desulfurase CsdA [Thaumasiovibrio subtropicus]|uniref:cysteine desulfurase CsdA n=1 Tax=Thaumasiovibrio subtropicus TaxID=1891207 RepID=UPI0018640AE6|nr:cysteine desulfurase CsdA [Thaumasiovibrio subtropicus]
MFDIDAIRRQFPALQVPAAVYLDSAATAQKPKVVLDAIQSAYQQGHANVHRGNHQLTANATAAFEAARKTVQHFINATFSQEIIWTRGATEALNLIAQSYARPRLQPGDIILVGEMEHHANIVPWQMVAEQTGATIQKIPMSRDCQLDMAAFDALLTDKVKIVAVAHITNVTGTRQPIETLIQKAHEVGAIVVVDGAQGIVHENVDVQALDADFYVFSGHKLFAPTGIGVLYGKKALLDAMPPWHGGGKMVEKVSFSGTTFTGLPGKFEAGTPNISGAVALSTAIQWLSELDRDGAEAHILTLKDKAIAALSSLDDLRFIGLQTHSGVFSFVIDGIHYQDIAMLLDQQNIAVRAGNHCAHPLCDALNIAGTIRVSIALYNTEEDIDKFIAALTKACDLL